MNNKQLLVGFLKVALVIIAVILGSKFSILPGSKEKKFNAALVASMDACLESEKNKGHGQDHLDSTYRLCWMRAKTDASK